jgi:YHS domain-containing protein
MKAAAAGIYGEISEDPACAVEVDQTRARAADRTVTYQGQTFYFSSDDCKAQFEKEPARFAPKAGGDSQPHGTSHPAGRHP